MGRRQGRRGLDQGRLYSSSFRYETGLVRDGYCTVRLFYPYLRTVRPCTCTALHKNSFCFEREIWKALRPTWHDLTLIQSKTSLGSAGHMKKDICQYLHTFYIVLSVPDCALQSVLCNHVRIRTMHIGYNHQIYLHLLLGNTQYIFAYPTLLPSSYTVSFLCSSSSR